MSSQQQQQQQQNRRISVAALPLFVVLLFVSSSYCNAAFGSCGSSQYHRRLIALRELRAIDTAPEATTATTKSKTRTTDSSSSSSSSILEKKETTKNDQNTIQVVVKENNVLFGQEPTTTTASSPSSTTDEEKKKKNDLQLMEQCLLQQEYKSLNNSRKTKQVPTKKTRQILSVTKEDINDAIMDTSSYIPLRPSAGIDTFEQQQKPIMDRQKKKKNPTRPSMGVLGDRLTPPPSFSSKEVVQRQEEELLQEEHPLLSTPSPGTILLETDDFIVRTATMADDHEIALLRLSVFSDFTTSTSSSSNNNPAVMESFCARSTHVLQQRRNRGATCLVVTDKHTNENNNNNNSQQKRNETSLFDPRDGILPSSSKEEEEGILGSMECSIHEFYQTSLGYRRPPQSCLYMTEVAVHPNHRRKGVGRVLLQALDKLVRQHRPLVESLYLHVDVKNEAALKLYQQAGYRILVNTLDYTEFTYKLNLHDGATRGRNHYILGKHTVSHPTWY